MNDVTRTIQETFNAVMFDGARWVFTNGSASSCKVLEVGK